MNGYLININKKLSWAELDIEILSNFSERLFCICKCKIPTSQSQSIVSSFSTCPCHGHGQVKTGFTCPDHFLLVLDKWSFIPIMLSTDWYHYSVWILFFLFLCVSTFHKEIWKWIWIYLYVNKVVSGNFAPDMTLLCEYLLICQHYHFW